MIIKKISFVLIVFVFSIMGAVISSASAEIASEKATKEVERIARRDNMIAGLKAQYAAKLAATKTEVTKIVVENKVEATEIAAEKITDVKDAVESASEHEAEDAKSGADEIISDVKGAVESASEHAVEEAKSGTELMKKAIDIE